MLGNTEKSYNKAILTDITLTNNIAQTHQTGSITPIYTKDKETGKIIEHPLVSTTKNGKKMARFGINNLWKIVKGKKYYSKAGLIFTAVDNKITPNIISEIEKLKEGDYIDIIAVLAPYKPSRGPTRAYYMVVDLITDQRKAREKSFAINEREVNKILNETINFYE